MSEYAVVKSPEVLAVEINAIKQQAQTMMLQASSEIGKRLVEAKDQVAHGEWGKWLQENVEYSQSTANRLMQIYTEYGTNSATLHNLSYSKAVALLGIDASEREVFVQEHNVDDMSARELQQAIKEKKALEKQLKAQEKEAATAEQEAQKLAKKVEELEKQLEAAQTVDDNEAEVQQLRDELSATASRANELERKLKEKPLEAATVTVQEVPPEVQRELEQLRSKLSDSTDPSEVKFRVRFESLVSNFNSTLEALETIDSTDTKQKFQSAMLTLLDKMRGTLEETS